MTREGAVILYVPDPSNAYIGDRLEPARLEVFYNPLMELNRDLSVIALEAYASLYAPHRPVNVVDGFTATGVRAVRYIVESSSVGVVYAGDIDQRAVELARLNALANGVSDRVRVYRADFRELVYRLRREGQPLLYIDVDPYGTPQPFIQASIESVGHRGMIGVTATDLAVLEGGKPRTAYRRYGSRLVKTPVSKEIAVRVLLGYIARVASSLDKSIKPLLSYYDGHYIRLFVLVERGARRADSMLSTSIGYAYYCWATGAAYLSRDEGFSCPRGEDPIKLGPLWVSRTNDSEFLEYCLRLINKKFDYVYNKRKITSLVETLIDEERVGEGIFIQLVHIARSLGVNVPRRDEVIVELRRRGYRASRTHYSTTGVRTDADIHGLYEVVMNYWRAEGEL